MKHLILCGLVGLVILSHGRMEAQSQGDPPPDFIVRITQGDTLKFSFHGDLVKIYNRSTGETMTGVWYYY